MAKSEQVGLTYGQNIYQTGAIIRQVYFPESGIISLLSTVDGDLTLEVGIVGSEGMIGLPAFLGAKTSNNIALVQGEGIALRMTVDAFLEECASSENLQRVVKCFAHSLMVQTAQSAACNRFHSVESRMARWLLMTNDRMKTEIFQITQEFLSNMVGVRREAVSRTAGNLQDLGLISYYRGMLKILDRKGLEALSCTCYKIISTHRPNYKAISGPPDK